MGKIHLFPILKSKWRNFEIYDFWAIEKVFLKYLDGSDESNVVSEHFAKLVEITVALSSSHSLNFFQSFSQLCERSSERNADFSVSENSDRSRGCSGAIGQFSSLIRQSFDRGMQGSQLAIERVDLLRFLLEPLESIAQNLQLQLSKNSSSFKMWEKIYHPLYLLYPAPDASNKVWETQE